MGIPRNAGDSDRARGGGGDANKKELWSSWDCAGTEGGFHSF